MHEVAFRQSRVLDALTFEPFSEQAKSYSAYLQFAKHVLTQYVLNVLVSLVLYLISWRNTQILSAKQGGLFL